MIIGVDFVDLDFFFIFFYCVYKDMKQLDSTPQVAKLGKTTPGIRIDSWLN